MTPTEILLRQASDEASLKAMTSGLRRQKDIANLSQLSGDPTLGSFGANYGASADDKLNTFVGQREKQADRDLTQSYYEQIASQNTLANTLAAERLAEQKRAALAGEEAALYRQTQRNPTTGVMNKAEEVVGTLHNLDLITQTFKDDYAQNTWLPFEGRLSNTLGKTPVSSQAQRDQSQWWADYRKMYELGARHALFGSALTEPEKEAWEQANINPGAPPDVIRRGLASMSEIAQRKALQWKKLHESANYSDEFIQSTYGTILGHPSTTDDPTSPAPGGAPQGVPALGGAPQGVPAPGGASQVVQDWNNLGR